MTDINDRIQAIRADRAQFRRELDSRTTDGEIPLPTEEDWRLLDASFLRDRERWDEGYVALTATKLHERATAAQNGSDGASQFVLPPVKRWIDVPEPPED